MHKSFFFTTSRAYSFLFDVPKLLVIKSAHMVHSAAPVHYWSRKAGGAGRPEMTSGLLKDEGSDNDLGERGATGWRLMVQRVKW